MRVLVIGGGIGGFTAATAFAQRGAETLLIEKRDSFDVPGVGLGQPANALRVYDDLGVLDEVLEVGFVYEHMSIFDSQRQLIAEHEFLLGDERVPAVCALSRADLHRILAKAAETAGVEVRTGTTAVAFDDADGGVSVTFASGVRERFDLVAGFDGIRSTTRKHIVGDAFEPVHSGYGAWRIQVPRRPEVTGMEFWQGIGSKTGVMPLSEDWMYVFHIRPEEPGVFFERERHPELLRERMSEYGDFIAEVVDGLGPDSDIVYSPMEPGIVPRPWTRGRVVIGGDAAHTFPPHLTQGAAMAAEDALVLAVRATDESLGTLEERLDVYARERYSRALFVYSFSRSWLESEQSIDTADKLAVARDELARNASFRIARSDLILNEPLFVS